MSGRAALPRTGALLALVAALALLAACGRGDPDVEVIVDGSVLPSGTTEAITAAGSTPAAAPAAASPTAPPSLLEASDLHGFLLPIEGACLPDSDNLMPNAPRTYRHGVHEGLDFYHLSSCAPVSEGTAILAMYGGVVVRADHDYVDLTAEQVEELAAKTAAQGFTDAETLDIYRGRQVWIDHGNGIVTRYCHMASIAPGIEVGAQIQQGQVLGGVGESGTPESVTAPGTELHLHAEVRVGDSFLGAELPPDQVRALYERLFSPAAE